ncbi:MAG: nitroreductase family protein [Acidobacteriota bacterium]
MRPRGTLVLSALLLALAAGTSSAHEPAPVRLPAPRITGGMPLMQALALRATSRAFAPDPLPPQVLSNLLWAAWGINRPGEGKRTAPSARNWQEIDLVVVDATGAFVYDAAGNLLKPLVAGDHRALTGTQGYAKDAPVTLVFVADTARMKGVPAADVQAYAWADAAFISQDVYLFCASEGLATGVRASVDRTALAKALRLAPGRIIVFAQSVGYPKT